MIMICPDRTRSPRSNRSGRRGCWPSCVRTSRRSIARISYWASRANGRLSACSVTPTRRARCGVSTAYDRPTRCGALTWSWSSCSRRYRWRVRTARDSTSPWTVSIRTSVSTRITSASLYASSISTSLTSSTATVGTTTTWCCLVSQHAQSYIRSGVPIKRGTKYQWYQCFVPLFIGTPCTCIL